MNHVKYKRSQPVLKEIIEWILKIFKGSGGPTGYAGWAMAGCIKSTSTFTSRAQQWLLRRDRFEIEIGQPGGGKSWDFWGLLGARLWTIYVQSFVSRGQEIDAESRDFCGQFVSFETESYACRNLTRAGRRQGPAGLHLSVV